MDFEHYKFGGQPTSGIYQSHVYKTSQPRADGLVAVAAAEAMIDPQLTSITPPPPFPQWSIPSMQRYLDEPQTGLLAPLHPIQNNHVHRPLAGVAPLPPASQHGRHGSPESQHPSSASSDQGPSESDRYHDPNCPSTPPDMAMSPRPLQCFDPWEGELYFSGFAANACVNPHDVNPSHGSMEFDTEPGTMDFTSFRGFSFDSVSTTHQSLEAGNGNGNTSYSSEFMPPPRTMSPVDFEPPIKDEIHARPEIIIPPAPVYPSPSPDNSHDENASEDEIEVKIKDEDNEWKPRQPSRNGSFGSRTKAARPHKRSAASDQRTSEKNKRARVESISDPSGPSKMVAVAPGSSKTASFSCSECKSTSFKDDAGLQKHIKQQHTRPFTCVFGYAGCTSTFASKNEWKRHVVSQHLVLQFWLCTQDGCAKVTNNAHNSRKGVPAGGAGSLPNGAIFNRKDLYTQHVRRMHTPPHVKKAIKNKKATPEWDERLKVMQAEAVRDRCALPTHMRCPANGCQAEFNGPNAWDERMEHVARHLEKAAMTQEPPVEFGGQRDKTLTQWACSPAVNVVQLRVGRWHLNNPLKGNGAAAATGINGAASHGKAHSEGSDADADAESEVDI